MYGGGIFKIKAISLLFDIDSNCCEEARTKELEREEACEELKLGEEKAQARNGPAFDKEEPD